MLSSEGRYHYDAARKAGKIVIWRALPRVGKRPAELKWDVRRCADEVMNLWDEQPHGGTELFVPYNELDLNDERGDHENDFARIPERLSEIATFLGGLYPELRRRLPDQTKILFPPFTPDHGDIAQAHVWEGTARAYDGLVVHAYADPAAARERLVWYLERFPHQPIFLGEWNSDDPSAFLGMLRGLEERYPNFRGATYFAWHWYDAPSHWPPHYDVDRNPDLYRLLMQATPITKEPPPMTRQERIDLICRIADEFGLDRAELLGGGFAESGINLDQETRYGVWPDVSFGMYHQTVAYADEGDHTDSAANIDLIKDLYIGTPEHAVRTAATKFKYWRYEPEVSALTAWCAYNWPQSYHNPEMNPNIGNYRRGLRDAARELGAAPSLGDRIWGPDIPDDVIRQKNDWSCAVRSTYAALWAMAQGGIIEPVSYGDEGPRDVYEWMVPEFDEPSVGLKRADGSGLVEMLARHGIKATAAYPTTLEDVQARAGRQPILLGGRAWNHWAYCKGLESDGTLILENPSPGFGGIGNQLRDSFGRLGPMTMVYIDVPAPPGPSPFSFQFGFKDLATSLGGAVGTPIEHEFGLDTRFNIQRTTSGIMIYSKAENRSIFLKG